MEDSLQERMKIGLHVDLTNLLCYLCYQQFDSEDEFRNHSHCNANNIAATVNDEFIQVKLEIESEPEVEPDLDHLVNNAYDEQNENISTQDSNEHDNDYNIENNGACPNRKRRRRSERTRNSNNSQRRGSTKSLDLNITKRRRKSEDLYLDNTKENQNFQQEEHEVDNVSNLNPISQISLSQQRKPLRCLENLDEIQVHCEVCAIKYTSLKLFMQHLYSVVGPSTVNDTNEKNRQNETSLTNSTKSTISNKGTGNFCFECKETFNTIQLYKNHMKTNHSQEQQSQRKRNSSASFIANKDDNSNSQNYNEDFIPSDADMMETMEENENDASENEEDQNIENEDGTKKSRYQLTKRTHKCEICAKQGIVKAFKFKCHLDSHITAHSGKRLGGTPKKKYECPGCSHNFKCKMDLQRHLGSDMDTLKSCTYKSCSATFVYKCLLRNHLREHKGVAENPYKCNFKNCQKSFSTPEQLSHHVAVKLHSWDFHRSPSAKSKTPTTTTKIAATTTSTTTTTPSRVAKKSTANVPKVIKTESLAPKNNSSEITHVQYTIIKSDTIKPLISLKIENDNPNSSPTTTTTTTADINNIINNENNEPDPILDFENCLLINDNDNNNVDNILDTEVLTPGSPSSLICNSPVSISQTNDEDDDYIENDTNEESSDQNITDQKVIVESASEKQYEENQKTEDASKSKRSSQRTLRNHDDDDDDGGNNSNDNDNNDDDYDSSSSIGFEKKHKCKTCSKTFKFQCHLRRHSFTHLNTKPPKDFRCAGCSRIFRTKENHRQHVQSNQLLPNEPRLKCSFEDSCPDLSYNYRCTLKQHLQTHIARGQKPKPHVCKQCPRKFRSAYDLKKHQETHEKKHKVRKYAKRKKIKPTKFSDNDDDYDSENDTISETLKTVDVSTKESISGENSNDNDNSDNSPPPPQKVRKKKTKQEKLAEKKAKYTSAKRKHVCETCATEGIVKAFKFRCHLRRHMFTHDESVRYPGNDNRKPSEKKHECPGCHRKFAFTRELNQHKAANNTGLLETEQLTEESRETRDNEGGEKEPTRRKLKCVIESCGAEFEWRCSYRNHIREHKQQGLKIKPFSCSFEGCHQKFASRYDQKQHIKRHNDKKSYLCNLCGKALSTAAQLEYHVLNHEGDAHKTFKCDFDGCNRSFMNNKLRVLHKNTVHLGIRNFLCPECGLSFKQPGNLSAHMLTHSEVKKFECQICGRRMSTKGQMTEHMKKHENRRTHKCHYCDKAFNARATLRRHIFCHTGEKRAKCPYCPKAYPDPRTLRHHLSRHHPEAVVGGTSNSSQNVNVTQPNFSSSMERTQNTNSDDSDSYSE